MVNCCISNCRTNETSYISSFSAINTKISNFIHRLFVLLYFNQRITSVLLPKVDCFPILQCSCYSFDKVTSSGMKFLWHENSFTMLLRIDGFEPKVLCRVQNKKTSSIELTDLEVSYPQIAAYNLPDLAY